MIDFHVDTLGVTTDFDDTYDAVGEDFTQQRPKSYRRAAPRMNVRWNSDDDETPFDSRRDGSDQSRHPLADGGADAVDVFEYEESVSVVAEIPSINEDDVDIQCDGYALAIRIATQSQPIVLQVDLPTYVAAGSAETNYNNGILEVSLDQEYDPANIGFQ